MSTYLQLCQDVARESGTVSGTLPTAVTSQTGRLLKIVEWVDQAWVDIQRLHENWRWMQGEFSVAITAGTARYTAAGLGITDLRRWRKDKKRTSYRPHTIYLTSSGVSDEGALLEMSWEEWRTIYGRGSQTNNRPTRYAISPANEFCLGPVPDDDYTVQGEYDKASTRLTADGDTPAMPSEFHELIVWKALAYLAAFDEARDQFTTAMLNYERILFDLRKDQLPAFEIGSDPVA